MRTSIKAKTFVCLLVLIFLFTTTYAAFFTTNSQSNFNEGTYSNTFYNTSTNAVQLNYTVSGNYTSRIFTANYTASWNNITWTQNAIGELPSNKKTETEFGDGNIDMSGNVLLLHMNEQSGTILDYSGEGNNGTQSGGISYNSSGKLRTALKFDGKNDYINCGNDASLNLRYYLTIEAWIKLDTISPTHGYHSAILDRENTYWFYVANTGVLGFLRFKNGEYDAVGSTTTISAGTWTHVCATYNNSATNEVKIYINGQLDNTGSLNGPIDNLNRNVLIGTRGTYHYLNGTIDEVAVWNRTLSDSEILSIYKRGISQLNVSIRSCDDASCSGENFSNNLTAPDNRYFQYKAEFETDNINYTPSLYNVTINYTLLPDTTYPSAFNLIPSENSSFNITETIEIAVNATDDFSIDTVFANITYPDNTAHKVTLSKIGITDKYNNSFTIPILFGRYNISIIANDTSNNINNTETTYVTVINTTPPDTTPPSVLNITPLAGTNFSMNAIVDITVNVTDNVAVDTVFANITKPDQSIIWLQLFDNDNDDVYNNSVIANQPGIYYVDIIANDTSGNINNTETTNFDPAGLGGGGGGGGGGVSSRSYQGIADWRKNLDTQIIPSQECIESWICPDWTECSESQQTRTCEDWNKCGTEKFKPIETKECQETKEINKITGEPISEGRTRYAAIQSSNRPFGLISAGIAVIACIFLFVMTLSKNIKKKKIEKNKKIKLIQKNKQKIISKLKKVYKI